jgi:hypothetical protein
MPPNAGRYFTNGDAFTDGPATTCPLTVPDGSVELYKLADAWSQFVISGNGDGSSNITTAHGSCGDNLTWELNFADGTLSISGTGAMTNYETENYAGREGVAPPWYSCRTVIKTVTIGSGVTAIGNDAFYKCDSVTSISIPNNVTSIGEEAFYGCIRLAAITCLAAIPPIVGTNAFTNANQSTCELNVPDGSVYLYELVDVWKEFVISGNGDGSSDGFIVYLQAENTRLRTDSAALRTANSNLIADTVRLYNALQAAQGVQNTDSINSLNARIADLQAQLAACKGNTTAVTKQSAQPLQLYPSPTTGLVYVDNPDGAEVEVYTLGGALVLRSKAAVIDLSQYAAGTYIIKVGNKAAKVVKQ